MEETSVPRAGNQIKNHDRPTLQAEGRGFKISVVAGLSKKH